MPIKNESRPFNDLELKEEGLKNNIDVLSKRLDSYNQMVEDVKSIDVELEKKREELEAIVETIKDKNTDGSNDKDNFYKELTIISDKIVVKEKELADIKNDKIIENNNLNETKELVKENEDKVSDYKVKLESLLSDIKLREVVAEDTKQTIKELRVELSKLKKEEDNLRDKRSYLSNDLLKLEEDSKVKINKLNSKIEELKDDNVILEKNNLRYREESKELKQENKELEKERDAKLKEFSDKQKVVDQGFGEISMRESELDVTKDYLRRVVKQLADIDPKKLSRIDLSKI